MFVINEDMSIHVTRGDACTIDVSATNNEEMYTFEEGDTVRLNVMEKRNCSNVVLTKDVVAIGGEESLAIALSGEDTKIGEVINKPTDYWYEVQLNPETQPQTIIGYDEDGGKVFRLYPEGGE